MELYIIVKQSFFQDNGSFYQVTDYNPIVAVYRSADEAIKECDRLVRSWIWTYPDYKLKTNIPAPGFGFVARYGLYDGDICMVSYNIINETAL